MLTETERGKRAGAMWSAFDCNPCSSPVFLPPFPLQPKPNQAVSEIRVAARRFFPKPDNLVLTAPQETRICLLLV